MKLETGSEERFSEFIRNLGDLEKIALISHTDLDGLAAAKITNKVIGADLVRLVGYSDLNESLVEELRKKEISKTVFTDLFIRDESFLKEIEKFSDVLILDHHSFRKDWNSDKTVFIRCEEGYSAGYLCYELFGKNKNIESLDWLAACCCISDYCHVKPREWLERVYEKYGDEFEILDDGYVRKSGKFWDLQNNLSLAMIYFKGDLNRVFESVGERFGDIGGLEKYSRKVNAEIENWVRKFDKGKESFGEGYFFMINPKFEIGSILSNTIYGREPSKYFVIARLDRRGANYVFSVRRKDKLGNADSFVTRLLSEIEGSGGGGHVAAAGGHFPRNKLEKIRKRLGIEN